MFGRTSWRKLYKKKCIEYDHLQSLALSQKAKVEYDDIKKKQLESPGKWAEKEAEYKSIIGVITRERDDALTTITVLRTKTKEILGT